MSRHDPRLGQNLRRRRRCIQERPASGLRPSTHKQPGSPLATEENLEQPPDAESRPRIHAVVGRLTRVRQPSPSPGRPQAQAMPDKTSWRCSCRNHFLERGLAYAELHGFLRWQLLSRADLRAPRGGTSCRMTRLIVSGAQTTSRTNYS